MSAIYKRELKEYFHTFIGYIFIAITVLLISLYFYIYNLEMGYPYFSYTMQGCTLILTIAIPILAMRLFSQERKSKTDQLILTAPVSVNSIVFGKYFSALTVFSIPVVISCVYPLLMSRFGIVPMGESYLAILAFFLLGASGIAISMLFSSVFENQILSALLSFLSIIVCYMLGALIDLIGPEENILIQIVRTFDISSPLDLLVNGVLDFKAVIYYLSVVALFIFMTRQSLLKRRCNSISSMFKKGCFSIAGIIISILLFIGMNVGISQIPDSYSTIDLSYNTRFSLERETIEFLHNLDTDINIYVWNEKGTYDSYVTKILEKYENESDYIHVSYIDPTEYPRFYLDYVDEMPSVGSLIVEADGRSSVIDYDELYVLDYSNIYSTGTVDTVGFDGEGRINSAISYIIDGYTSTVGIIVGHNETDLDDEYLDILTKANLDKMQLNLLDVDSIPAQISILILNAPMTDLSEIDVEKIISFLDNGGKILINLALTGSEMTNLDKLLDYMEVSEVQGMVVEHDPNYYLYTNIYLLPDVYSNDYTENIPNYILAPSALALFINEESEQVSYEVILETTEDSYVKMNYNDSIDFDENDGDQFGPIIVGVEARKQVANEEGIITNPVMLVFSSATMFTTEIDSYVSSSNLTMFKNIISNMIDSDSTVLVAQKSFNASYLTVPTFQKRVLATITILILPLCFIVAGIVILIRRKKF